MQAAYMTFEEEALKSRSIIRRLNIKNTNLKRSNDCLGKRVLRLEKENLLLKKENRILKQKQRLFVDKQTQLEKQIENLNLIVEELRNMVFGKKKTKDDKDKSSEEELVSSQSTSTQTTKRAKANRSKESYRRSKPKDSEVTNVINHPLTHCPDCGTLLIALKQIIRYTEDLVNLTELTKLLKSIQKHIIGNGYCLKCKSRKTAKEISPQVSILGENVKKFVCYLSIVMRLSFEQIRCFMRDTADFTLSDGEITACLDEQAKKLKPEGDRLLQKVGGAPARYYDETGWNTKGGLGNYAWITRPTEDNETIFLMGRSRGKGNAEELQGKIDNQVGISDDYAAYDNLFAKHQPCMAHPNRKLKDLKESKTISPASKATCNVGYESFSNLYTDLEKTLKTEYEKELWLQKKDKYTRRLKEMAIKQSLAENAQKYFTCLLQHGIPADNNKAERGLRHIVLKRKISYGSKSQKGADTMSILCSTLLSCWWNKPNNFFVAYNQMLTTQEPQ